MLAYTKPVFKRDGAVGTVVCYCKCFMGVVLFPAD